MDCSFHSEGSLCGVSGQGSGILLLLACKRDMTSHLVSLGVSGKRGQGKTGITESELILNRAGLFGTVNEEEIQAMTICPKHRKELTTDWPGRKGQLCCYPSHKGQKRQLSLPRCINAPMSAEIFLQFNVVVPIGAGKVFTFRLCFIVLHNFCLASKGWKIGAVGNPQASLMCYSVTYAYYIAITARFFNLCRRG